MAAPVINTTTSVLGYKQWETWNFQPVGTPPATYWNVSGLPAGMDFNAVSGLISGAAEVPGVYDIGLIAGNDDGISAQIVITIGIEATGIAVPSDEVDLWINLQTREVSNAYPPKRDDNPLYSLKQNDDVFFRLRFHKNGVVADLDLDSLFFAIKELDSESILMSSSTWEKIGTGENTSYRLRATLTDAKIDSALSNYEEDTGTKFTALSEFEWYAPALLGGGTSVSSSQTFPLEIVREIHIND